MVLVGGVKGSVWMFGSHLSIAGGLHNALTAAEELGCECLQVFTKNQRQWRAPRLTQQAIDAWLAERERTGITELVSHDSYLINLAAVDETVRGKSLALFRDEIERCEALGIGLLVAHPGSHKDEGEEAGLRRIAEAIDQVHAELPGYRTITCLENTAGQGTALGYRLEHLRWLIEAVREPERLGVCIDTAHALAAGYDLTSAAGAKAFLQELDEVVGIERVLAMHVNDSKTQKGSRVDRHEHIGHGYVAMEAFATVVNEPRLKRVPKILETPKKKAPDGREWDAINLEVLRGIFDC